MASIAKHVAVEIAIENFDLVAFAAAATALAVADFDVGRAMKVFEKLKSSERD